MHLYERCREARRRTGLSQEALAVELGVSRVAVAQWEMEQGTSPSVENMAALAKRSGVMFEWLATGRGETVFGQPRAIEEEREKYGRLSPSQVALLEGFDRLAKPKRDALLALLRAD